MKYLVTLIILSLLSVEVLAESENSKILRTRISNIEKDYKQQETPFTFRVPENYQEEYSIKKHIELGSKNRNLFDKTETVYASQMEKLNFVNDTVDFLSNSSNMLMSKKEAEYLRKKIANISKKIQASKYITTKQYTINKKELNRPQSFDQFKKSLRSAMTLLTSCLCAIQDLVIDEQKETIKFKLLKRSNYKNDIDYLIVNFKLAPDIYHQPAKYSKKLYSSGDELSGLFDDTHSVSSTFRSENGDVIFISRIASGEITSIEVLLNSIKDIPFSIYSLIPGYNKSATIRCKSSQFILDSSTHKGANRINHKASTLHGDDDDGGNDSHSSKASGFD